MVWSWCLNLTPLYWDHDVSTFHHYGGFMISQRNTIMMGYTSSWFIVSQHHTIHYGVILMSQRFTIMVDSWTLNVTLLWWDHDVSTSHHYGGIFNTSSWFIVSQHHTMHYGVIMMSQRHTIMVGNLIFLVASYYLNFTPSLLIDR